MGGGFKFDVLDMKKNRNVVLKCPEEIYELIALIGTTPRYTVARVWRARDDLELLMVHEKGEDDPKIHQIAFNAFMEASKKAQCLKLYGAGQDLLKTAFSGNIRGMGPGCAEIMEYTTLPQVLEKFEKRFKKA